MACAESHKARCVLGASLRAAIEDCVAAAGICFDGMLRAGTVPQPDLARVAGSPTIGIIGAFGDKSAEDAVFHVKHGHVLMQRDLKPLGRRSPQQSFELPVVQVV